MANLLTTLNTEGIDYSTLGREAEYGLIIKAQAGDEEARETLLIHNTAFIQSQARKFHRHVMSARKRKIIGIDDLVQEGIVGFNDAIKKFDPDTGYKLISYAIWHLRARWLTYINEYAGACRLPGNRATMITKLIKARDILQQRLSREPSISELAEELDTCVGEVIDTQMLLFRSSVRIDTDETRHSIERASKPIAGEYGKPANCNLTSACDVEKNLLQESLNTDILKALDMLTTREKKIVSLYFGINQELSYSLEDIADLFNLPRKRIRQIKEKAMRKLRHSNQSKDLRGYLG